MIVQFGKIMNKCEGKNNLGPGSRGFHRSQPGEEGDGGHDDGDVSYIPY